MSPRGARARRRPSPFVLGLALLGAAVLVAVGVVVKPRLETLLGPGETVVAEFRDNYRDRLIPFRTVVKLAGLQVGRVAGVEATDHGTTLVTMRIDEDLETLGPAPSAAVAPLTLLGGGYAVELFPGGGAGELDPDVVIPIERTRVPVELDAILDTLPADARTSLQGTVGGLERTLADGGGEALSRLAATAPPTLGPTGGVLDALRGPRPGEDLPQLVRTVESAARVLAERDRAVGEVVEDLGTTTAVLARNTRPLADTVAALPATLDRTRTGLDRLDGTLQRLTGTAADARPAVRELSPALAELTPVLRRTQPLLSDLRPLLADARPAVDELTPTAERATEVVDDLRGPVLDRLNGPVLSMLLGTYQGTGPFEGSGGGVQADHRFFEELAYMVTGLGRATQTQDANGAMLNFQFGAGSGTPAVGRLSFEQMVRQFVVPPGAPRPPGPGAPQGGAPLPAPPLSPIGGGR